MEGGLELVVIGAAKIGVDVDDHAGEVLACGRTHEAGFPVVGGKALLDEDGCDVLTETRGVAGEVAGAGEGQVVSVAGVGGAGGLGEAREAEVEPIGQRVGEAGDVGAPCGRCGRP